MLKIAKKLDVIYKYRKTLSSITLVYNLVFAILRLFRPVYFRVVREIGARFAPTSDRIGGQAT